MQLQEHALRVIPLVECIDHLDQKDQRRITFLSAKMNLNQCLIWCVHNWRSSKKREGDGGREGDGRRI